MRCTVHSQHKQNIIDDFFREREEGPKNSHIIEFLYLTIPISEFMALPETVQYALIMTDRKIAEHKVLIKEIHAIIVNEVPL